MTRHCGLGYFPSSALAEAIAYVEKCNAEYDAAKARTWCDSHGYMYSSYATSLSQQVDGTYSVDRILGFSHTAKIAIAVEEIAKFKQQLVPK